MFNSLSEKLEGAFKNLKGEARINDLNVANTIKDIRRALIDADVNFKIAKEFTDKVKEKLVDLGYDPKMGARPLRRTIQDQIEDAITDFYLENPNEKDLRGVMTNNGTIQIKAQTLKEK